jgi:hypothetical protein
MVRRKVTITNIHNHISAYLEPSGGKRKIVNAVTITESASLIGNILQIIFYHADSIVDIVAFLRTNKWYDSFRKLTLFFVDILNERIAYEKTYYNSIDEKISTHLRKIKKMLKEPPSAKGVFILEMINSFCHMKHHEIFRQEVYSSYYREFCVMKNAYLFHKKEFCRIAKVTDYLGNIVKDQATVVLGTSGRVKPSRNVIKGKDPEDSFLQISEFTPTNKESPLSSTYLIDISTHTIKFLPKHLLDHNPLSEIVFLVMEEGYVPSLASLKKLRFVPVLRECFEKTTQRRNSFLHTSLVYKKFGKEMSQFFVQTTKEQEEEEECSAFSKIWNNLCDITKRYISY